MRHNKSLWLLGRAIAVMLLIGVPQPRAAEEENAAPTSAPSPLSSSAYKLSFHPLSFSPGLKLTLSPTETQKKGKFPRVAVFLQRPYVWIVVTEQVLQDTSLRDFPPGYSAPEILPHPEAFVIRFKIPSAEMPSIDFDPSGVWHLSVGDQSPRYPFGSLPFLTGKLFAFLKEPSYLAINIRDVVPVHLKDPEKAADLIVIPTVDPGVGLPGVFRYANFHLHKTLQGFVFDPSSPNLTVTTGEFVKLSQEGGLLLSPLEDRRSTKKEQEQLVFLDFDAWQRRDLPYPQARRKLEDQLHKAAEEKRLRTQFAWAQFLLAHGNAEEAEAALRLILEYSPRLEEDAEFAALWGVSTFLNHNFLQALSAFSNPNLPPDTELWRGATLIKLGFTPEGVPLMMKKQSLLMNYPPPLKNELALVGARGCIQNEDKTNTEKFLAMINTKTLSSAQASTFATLQEDLIILGMDPALRESYVVQVMRQEGKKNPQTIADQDFKNIQQRLQKKSLSALDAIKLLEDLRTSWRGDDLEFSILQKLGELYGLQKDYFKAMEAYGRALSFFPHISEKTDVENKAREVFQKSLASSLVPFRKIAFFNQYIRFLPADEKKVDIAEKLSQELMTLDLPDQAISILEKELENKVDPRLLISLSKACLQDRQANKALRILNNPLLNEEQKAQVSYFRALSYAQLKKFETALAALQGDDTIEGEKLRIKIFEEQQDWTKAATTLKKVMAQTDPLDPHLLLQLTIALYMGGKGEELQDLRKKYQSLLQDTPEKRIFLLLTQPSYKGGVDLQKIKTALSQIKDFQELASQLLQENKLQ